MAGAPGAQNHGGGGMTVPNSLHRRDAAAARHGGSGGNNGYPEAGKPEGYFSTPGGHNVGGTGPGNTPKEGLFVANKLSGSQANAQGNLK